MLRYWVAIPAAVIAGGKIADRLLHLPPAAYGNLLKKTGWGLVTAGVLLIWRSIVDLNKGGGTPSPYRPAKILVTVGSYRLCRHPMWLGYHVSALGVVISIGSWGALLVSYPLLLFFSIRFLREEEQTLSLKFKEAHDEYRQKTPFLLPQTPFGKRRK